MRKVERAVKHAVRQASLVQPKISYLTAAVAVAMLGLGASAQAQQATPDVANNKLETVMVTANKRAQNLQDVPAAISVFNDATLQRANVRDLEDLPNLSPALTMSLGTQPGNFSINMRGVGTFSLGIGVEADVSVIVDDIPIGMQAGAFKDLADVFRIEVLKGPQSTLFGKSAIAGALNITTKPISGPMKANVSMLMTNDNEWRLGTSVSGAVTDTFRMRVAASKTNFDGTLRNLTTGNYVNGSKGDNLSGKFEWTPITDFDVTLSPHYNYTEKFCCSTAFTSMTPGGLYRGVPALPQSVVLKDIVINKTNVDIRNDYPTGGVFHDAGAGLKLNYLMGKNSPLAGSTLTSISSYSKYHMDDYQDNDATDLDVLQYLTLPNGAPTNMHGGLFQWGSFDVASTTQEFRLTSPDSGKFRYVMGLWYGKNELERLLIKAPLILSYGTAYGATASNTNKAIFGQSSWEFLPSTSLITGLRYNKEDTGYTFSRFTVPSGRDLPYSRTEYYAQDDSHKFATGRVGLETKFNKDTMAYGTYSTGHKGVAYDLTSGFSAALAKKQPIAAETAKNFELGVKASMLDNRAMVNVAVYRTNFKDFQQSASFFDYDGVFRTSLNSIGGLRTQGVEIDGNMRVIPQLLINTSFAYTKATITDFENGPCYSVLNAAGTAAVNGAGCAANPKFNNTNVQNLAGKTLPNAPKIKFNIGGQYDVPLASQGLVAYFTGAYRWQSETQFNLNQNPATIQGAYGIVNIGAGVKAKDDSFKVSAFINNLFSKSYAAGIGNATLNGTWTTKAPNPAVAVVTNEWTPPRDYKRYVGVRVDFSF